MPKLLRFLQSNLEAYTKNLTEGITYVYDFSCNCMFKQYNLIITLYYTNYSKFLQKWLTIAKFYSHTLLVVSKYLELWSSSYHKPIIYVNKYIYCFIKIGLEIIEFISVPTENYPVYQFLRISVTYIIQCWFLVIFNFATYIIRWCE